MINTSGKVCACWPESDTRSRCVCWVRALPSGYLLQTPPAARCPLAAVQGRVQRGFPVWGGWNPLLRAAEPCPAVLSSTDQTCGHVMGERETERERERGTDWSSSSTSLVGLGECGQRPWVVAPKHCTGKKAASWPQRLVFHAYSEQERWRCFAQRSGDRERLK